jgi:hypothetical protein
MAADKITGRAIAESGGNRSAQAIVLGLLAGISLLYLMYRR